MLCQPGLDDLGVMNLEVVQDQEDLPLGITNQSLHEIDQNFRIHGAVKKPEPYPRHLRTWLGHDLSHSDKDIWHVCLNGVVTLLGPICGYVDELSHQNVAIR